MSFLLFVLKFGIADVSGWVGIGTALLVALAAIYSGRRLWSREMMKNVQSSAEQYRQLYESEKTSRAEADVVHAQTLEELKTARFERDGFQTNYREIAALNLRLQTRQAEELVALQEKYEARIRELEKRMSQHETRADVLEQMLLNAFPGMQLPHIPPRPD